MKGIILALFLIATISLPAQELTPPTIDGKQVKIKKVFKKYVKEKKLHAAEFRYLMSYLLVNQYDSTKLVKIIGAPAKIENNNGQTVIIYDCIVNYGVAGFRSCPEKMYLYLDDKKRVAELKRME
jgi:hypothetical protein